MKKLAVILIIVIGIALVMLASRPFKAPKIGSLKAGIPALVGQK